MRRGTGGVFEHGIEVAGLNGARPDGALALGQQQREPPPRAQTQFLRAGAERFRQLHELRSHILRQQRRRVFKAFRVSHVDNLFARRGG